MSWLSGTTSKQCMLCLMYVCSRTKAFKWLFLRLVGSLFLRLVGSVSPNRYQPDVCVTWLSLFFLTKYLATLTLAWVWSGNEPDLKKWNRLNTATLRASRRSKRGERRTMLFDILSQDWLARYITSRICIHLNKQRDVRVIIMENDDLTWLNTSKRPNALFDVCFFRR